MDIRHVAYQRPCAARHDKPTRPAPCLALTASSLQLLGRAASASALSRAVPGSGTPLRRRAASAPALPIAAPGSDARFLGYREDVALRILLGQPLALEPASQTHTRSRTLAPAAARRWQARSRHPKTLRPYNPTRQ